MPGAPRACVQLAPGPFPCSRSPPAPRAQPTHSWENRRLSKQTFLLPLRGTSGRVLGNSVPLSHLRVLPCFL